MSAAKMMLVVVLLGSSSFVSAKRGEVRVTETGDTEVVQQDAAKLNSEALQQRRQELSDVVEKLDHNHAEGSALEQKKAELEMKLKQLGAESESVSAERHNASASQSTSEWTCGLGAHLTNLITNPLFTCVHNNECYGNSMGKSEWAEGHKTCANSFGTLIAQNLGGKGGTKCGCKWNPLVQWGQCGCMSEKEYNDANTEQQKLKSRPH